jgi:hypothetical protein
LDKIIPPRITQETLKQKLEYNAVTGNFVWMVVGKNGSAFYGAPAGTVGKRGYLSVKIEGINYKCHRLAWLYTYGTLPLGIDHIDGDKLNNRIDNLRECTQSTNTMNRARGSNNTSGFKGVSWYPSRSKWLARCSAHGKRKHIGFYDTAEEANTAYMDYAKKVHGEFYKGDANE